VSVAVHAAYPPFREKFHVDALLRRLCGALMHYKPKIAHTAAFVASFYADPEIYQSDEVLLCFVVEFFCSKLCLL
jgi:hypothetical protein